MHQPKHYIVQKHKCTKSQILVRLDIDKYSFYNMVMNEWNALNDEIIESTVHCLLFKGNENIRRIILRPLYLKLNFKINTIL